MAAQYAVIGNPVEHSLSPFIHQEFAKACGINLQYNKVLAPLDAFMPSLTDFIQGGALGANITVPFKTQAYFLADKLSDRASSAGAVNTLSFIDKKIHADNTDGSGLINDICNNLGFTIAGKRILLLGAGGAARGALFPILNESPAKLIIVNRSREKAQILAASAKMTNVVFASCYTSIIEQKFDLIINATSSSLNGEVPRITYASVASGALVYDMMYGKTITPFLIWAQKSSAGQISDGLGMLVEQAAESFFIWHGVRPASAPVLRLLRAKLAGCP